MSNPNCDKLGHLTTGTRVMCAECYNKQANAVKRVRELHYEDEYGQCAVCVMLNIYEESIGNEPYPCPTIQALNGEQSC